MKNLIHNRWVFILLVPLLVVGLLASVSGGGGGHHGAATEHANIDLNDNNSLQRGAKYYAAYCSGCHSLEYSRFNRVAKDIGLNEASGLKQETIDALLQENLIFAQDEDGKKIKVGSTMDGAYTAKDSQTAFGVAIPDLSLVARSRKPDWIYSYLKSFYVDESRPYGVNNTIFPNVGMPHVMWDLQGWQVKEDNHHGEKSADDHGSSLVLAKQGTLSPSEYDTVVRDITAFLTYVAEPYKLKRKKIGMFVMLFLLVLTVLSYMLKKEYWKDVH